MIITDLTLNNIFFEYFTIPIEYLVVAGGGGGGGAGSAASGRIGGTGLTNSISGSSATYAVGGDGGNTSGSGNTSGASNTGNAGRGSDGDATLSGSGGSEIVIIRYSDTLPAASSTTGSPTITVSGGFRIYQFTGSGSITI